MCFQRDSRKDQIIVWAFILGTTGLLGWAAIRKALEMREVKGLAGGLARLGALGRNARARGGLEVGTQEDRRGSYLPVGEQDRVGQDFSTASARPG
jgi:hypothetical protein